jgi:hypothetical protein
MRAVLWKLGARVRLRRGVEALCERIEYLEDSRAATAARAERDETALRPWIAIRRPRAPQRS